MPPIAGIIRNNIGLVLLVFMIPLPSGGLTSIPKLRIENASLFWHFEIDLYAIGLNPQCGGSRDGQMVFEGK